MVIIGLDGEMSAPDIVGGGVLIQAGTRDPFNLEEDAWLGAFHRMAGGDPTNGPVGGGS